MRAIPFIVYLLLLEINSVKQRNSNIFKKISKTLETYEKSERPPYNNATITFVEVAFTILSFSSISVIDMDYTVNVELKIRWLDSRLQLNNSTGLYNIVTFKDKIWIPDIYFRNSKDGKIHSVPVPKELLKLDLSNGMLISTQTMSLRLSCDMNLWKFPMDTQYCFMTVGSYSYLRDEIKLRWWLVNGIYGHYPKNDTSLDFSSAITVHNTLKMNEFEQPKTSCCFCVKEATNLGEFPCLSGVFKLERKFGFYITYVYIPSLMVLLVCWLSFFIDFTSAPARVSICVFSILSIISQGSSVINTLPKVSYPKAIDWWIFSCFSLVILSFIEYVLVNYFHGAMKKESRSRLESALFLSPVKVERFFRWAFPLLVVVLIFTYWTFYTTSFEEEANCLHMVTKSSSQKTHSSNQSELTINV